MYLITTLRVMLSVFIIIPILMLSACTIPVCCAPVIDEPPTHKTQKLNFI